ncbi:hypothetical protein E0Z10_g2753 [Xylaria hypoxylon]|uniref:Rhodopsin domain-containing protein n=1 Tax=Xylaria hypoxylon TaxID=37992 RepID=A0A4Z0YPZ0_9PEZI|nr:hypothetical protein E0Z10_g2753 [Xylaria hypoxylon]
MAPQDPNASNASNGGGLLAAAIVTLIISWLSVALRTYVRAGLTKSFQVDDWVMLAGLANFTISCSFIFAGISFGLGKHNKALSQHDEIEALKYQALATASYVSNMWLIKLSIGLFLYRLAVQKSYKYVLGISIIIVGVWSLALFFWNIFQCTPVAAQWDYTILTSDPKSHCVSVDEVVSAAYALSALTILSDFLYALIPIPMIWQVKMTSQTKLSVIAVLSLGVFASIATLIRLRFLADLTDVSDILHAGTDAMIWTLVEPGIAISAASLATIRPLLRRWRVRGFTSSERSRGTAPSQEPGSRIKKASNMPGFGPHDVTLVDIESWPTHTGKTLSPTAGIPISKFATHKVSTMPKIFDQPSDEYGVREEPPSAFHQNNTRRTEVKSETSFPIGGAESTQSLSDTHVAGTWLDQESDSSSIELTGPGNTGITMPPRPARRS